MNIFRLIGDLLHIASFILLILKIRDSRNCLGLSMKTQEIYIIVFCLRYIDLFMYYVSLYNSIMKILFIGCTIYIIFLMKFKKPYCLSYDPLADDFPYYKYIIPGKFILDILIYTHVNVSQGAILVTIFIHTETKPFEILWSFTIWLEAGAIIPQLRMLTKIKDVENITGNYVAALGLYRFFYILNWIYRYYVENYLCWTSTLGGIVQTIVYGDFLYYYLESLKTGKGIHLPV